MRYGGFGLVGEGEEGGEFDSGGREGGDEVDY